MEPVSIVNSLAVVAALASLALSVWIASRQSILARQAIHSPIISTVLREMMSSELVEAERKLARDIKEVNPDPANGYFALPEAIRANATKIASQYQTLAYLAAFGIVDKSVVFLPVHHRIGWVWELIKPYAEAERLLRGEPLSFLNYFEWLAIWTQDQDITKIVANHKKTFLS